MTWYLKIVPHVEGWIYFGTSVITLGFVWRQWSNAHAERLRREAEDIKFYDALR